MAHATLHDIGGIVLEPGDDGYDEARTVWNGMVDRHPRYIVRCADATDVAAAVQFATRNDLEIGVRCGGHGIVGHAVPDDGLMIDLRPMGDVQVDAVGRRARVQGGALLGALDRAAQQFGLATTAGNVSHTGVGGLALGGGMGWLARRLGLACDNVLAFELITADGEQLRVDRDSHRELDWALRGGGGNFGVVTAFEFALHPEPGDAIAVEFHYPIEDVAARRYASTMDGYASGAYVNVLGDDGDAGLRRAYPTEQLARLTAVKDTYDPGNVFHLNQNIRPTAGRA